MDHDKDVAYSRSAGDQFSGGEKTLIHRDARRIDHPKKEIIIIILAIFYGGMTWLFTRPFQQRNGKSVALLNRNTRWLNRSRVLRTSERCVVRAWLTSTDVGDDKIPCWHGRWVVSARSSKPTIESSSKGRTGGIETRLSHCMNAVVIFVNCESRMNDVKGGKKDYILSEKWKDDRVIDVSRDSWWVIKTALQSDNDL